ncbi:MAG: alpha/beta fold hydrolase [Anaerolineae bacterium]
MGCLTDLLELQTPSGVERITTAEQWQVRRAQIVSAFGSIIGEPPLGEPVPLEPEIQDGHDEGDYIRYRVTYSVDVGERVPAWLLVPKARAGRVPGVLVPHQTTPLGKDEPVGLGGNPQYAFARDLARRGYVTLAPDHVSAGERCTPGLRHYDTADLYRRYPEWSAVGKTIWDLQRALDFLSQRPEVDADRLGMIGHSLGGHSTLFTAGADERVKCAVSSCGVTTFAGDARRLEWARDHWYQYMPRLRPLFLNGQPAPFDFHHLAALIAPRAFLNLTALNDECFASTDEVAELTIRVNRVYRVLGAEGAFACYLHGSRHSCPDDARALAYAWMDRWLRAGED